MLFVKLAIYFTLVVASFTLVVLPDWCCLHSAAPTVSRAAPTVISAAGVAATNTITLNVNFAPTALFSGTIYCAALRSTSAVTISTIKAGATNPKSFLVGRSTATVLITGLKALTQYSTYCYIENKAGGKNTLSDVLGTKQEFTTLCCRVISFTNAPAFVYADAENVYTTAQSSQYVFSYQLSSAPSSAVTITHRIRDTNGTAVSAEELGVSPTTVTIRSSSVSLTRKFVLFGSEFLSGAYTISMEYSGSSAGELDPASVSVQVLASATTKPAPTLRRAQLAGSGASMSISFDGSTDQANIEDDTFSCDLIFIFDGAIGSTCSWTNSTTVRALFPASDGSFDLVEVGGDITVLPSVIRAECVSGTVCSAYNTTLAQTIQLLAPNTPISPTVVVIAPSIVSPCAAVPVDASGSTGSGGRPWSALEWVVTSSLPGDDVTGIQQVFNNTGALLGQIITIPEDLLTFQAVYSVSLTLTNYLGESNSATVLFTQDSNPNLPTATITGSSSLTTTRADVFIAYTEAIQAPCANDSQLSYQWSVLLDGEEQDFPSSSKDPATLLIDPYVLTLGATYTLRFEVTASATARYPAATAVAEAELFVENGDVVAIVSGGTYRLIYVEEDFTLDGSLSFDEDFEVAEDSVLDFSWSCSFLSISNFGESCDDVFGEQLTNQSSIPLNGTFLEPAQEYAFLLEVTSPDDRSDSVILTLELVNSGTTFTTISSTKSKINANSQLNLVGSVAADDYSLRAVWEAFVSGVEFDFASTALTPLSKQFAESAVSNVGGASYPLAVSKDTFTQGSSVTFRLSADVPNAQNDAFLSFTEVTITINSPPSPGFLTASPTAGIALSTTFTLVASDWSDDVEDLPFTYKFSYRVAASQPALTVKERSSSSSSSNQFPHGEASEDRLIAVEVHVFDALLAASSLTRDITVLPNEAIDISDYLDENLADFDDTGDPDMGLEIINSVGSTINGANCTLAPASFCATLYRSACLETPQTCSQCLSGFKGLSGDANTQCFPESTPADFGAVGALCESDSDCFLGACSEEEGVCAEPFQTCPSSTTDECSGHGSCIYRDSSRNLLARECTVSEASTCSASCVCVAGFGGEDCSLTSDELADLDAARLLLCRTVAQVSALSDPSPQLLDSLVSSLALSYNPYEVVSDAAAAACLDALNVVTQLAADGFLVGASDETAGLLVGLVSDFVLSPVANNGTEIDIAVSDVTQGLLFTMVNGQTDIAFVSENINMVTSKQLASDLAALAPPITPEEESAGAVASVSVEFVGGAGLSCDSGSGYVQLSLLLWSTNPFPKSEFLGSPLSKFESRVDGEGEGEGVAGTRGRRDRSLLLSTAHPDHVARSWHHHAVYDTGSRAADEAWNLGRFQSSGHVRSKATPAYYVVFQYNQPQNYEGELTIEQGLLEAQRAGRTNFSFPDCTLLDGSKYVDCKSCNVSSYTNFNVTFSCFDVTQVCPGSASVGDDTRVLSTETWSDSSHHPSPPSAPFTPISSRSMAAERMPLPVRQWAARAEHAGGNPWAVPGSRQQRARRELQEFLTGNDDGEAFTVGSSVNSVQYAAFFDTADAVFSVNPFAVDFRKVAAIVVFVR